MVFFNDLLKGSDLVEIFFYNDTRMEPFLKSDDASTKFQIDYEQMHKPDERLQVYLSGTIN